MKPESEIELSFLCFSPATVVGPFPFRETRLILFHSNTSLRFARCPSNVLSLKFHFLTSIALRAFHGQFHGHFGIFRFPDLLRISVCLFAACHKWNRLSAERLAQSHFNPTSIFHLQIGAQRCRARRPSVVLLPSRPSQPHLRIRAAGCTNNHKFPPAIGLRRAHFTADRQSRAPLACLHNQSCRTRKYRQVPPSDPTSRFFFSLS
jgi:hypothetical protein